MAIEKVLEEGGDCLGNSLRGRGIRRQGHHLPITRLSVAEPASLGEHRRKFIVITPGVGDGWRFIQSVGIGLGL